MAEDNRDREREVQRERKREIEAELDRVDEEMDAADLEQSDTEGLPEFGSRTDERLDDRHVEVNEETDCA
ncbi:hypothetical protein [Haladaptatus sp. DFWS20]|uniref:hypothetical protein n=1 Tax=Haladaptatus sp. DFWS20 TaxID=3403467 RepID=UPI003EB72B0B